MRKLLPLFLVVAATSGGATNCGEIIDDSGFDLWCGDSLCRWKVEDGEVARADTWHEGDIGVELVGSAVKISQISEVNSSDGHCIAFDLVADISEDAMVRLQMDVNGDTYTEFDERLPTADWRPLSYRVRMPDFYQGVRFRLLKEGGHAVLANIGARIVPDAECTDSPLITRPRPNGVACTADPQCASGTCTVDFFGGTCGECHTNVDCGGATPVCGVVPTAAAHLQLWATCVAAGSAPLNTACGVDAQCASGICEQGACSLCHDAADCNGAACLPMEYSVWHPDGSEPTTIQGASHCALGAPLAPDGGACLASTDCLNGNCVGLAQGMCATSWLPRRCNDDMECPGYGFGGEHACVTVGTRGATCR